NFRSTRDTHRRLAGATALTAALLIPMLTVPAAHAATVYELEGAWAPDVASPVQIGAPVGSTWYFNLNDDAAAPGNATIPNVTITFSAGNATFTTLPTSCLTESRPASAILADGAQTLCNVGPRPEGTAEV